MNEDNPVLNQLLNRRSIRQFTGESVKPEDLDLILKAAQRAPTSINGQQITLVYTRDKAKIKKIAELCADQPQVATADVFVTFVIDFNRTAYAIETTGKHQVVEQTAEGIITGTFDAGIMLSSLQTAAESLGYGTTAIGYVRAHPDKMLSILGLPPKTFPVCSTTIGVPTETAKRAPLKPRIPIESFAFEETYDDNKVKAGVDQYEDDFKKYRDTYLMKDLPTYKEKIAGFYGEVHWNKTAKTFEAQGFKFKDEA